MTEILRYLVVLEAIGLAGVPLAARALGRLPGAGLGFARVLAWLLFAWLVWLLGSLGVPNGIVLVLGCAAVVAGAALLLWRRGGTAPEPFAKRLWLRGELLFAGTFLGAAWLGAHSPEINSTEKPMDMMLINATITGDSFPPEDPWLSGSEVNYYYLGQHMLALVVRLTGVEPSVGYNLSLAAVFALCVTCAFTIGATLAEAGRRQGLPVRRPLLAGGLCAVLMMLMGNLRGGGQALGELGSLTKLDWFAASRVIPDAINEFPFFSLTLGDLHAHLLAIPVTLLALGFIVQAGLGGAPALRSRAGRFETFCAALALGWLYAVNSWSWPVMVGLFGLTVAVWLTSPQATARRQITLQWAAGVIVLGAVLILPFLLTFDAPSSGIGLTREAQREELGTFLRHHAVIEGALLFLLLAPLIARFRDSPHRWKLVLPAVGIAAIAGPLLASVRLGGAALWAVGLIATLTAAVTRRLTTVERMLWVLAAGAFACLFASEVGIIKDEFFGGPFERMNTIFKMGYQAWILLAVFGAVALAARAAWLPRLPRWAWTGAAAVLIAVGLAWTVGGTSARHEGLKGPVDLDGRLWLNASNPGDIAAIDWIRDNTDGDAVLLEAVGDDYSPFGNARMSTFTGRKAVLGWQGHEVQWNHDVGTRREDIQTLYTTQDELTVVGLLSRYKVDYVVVGPLERTTYGDLGAVTLRGREVFKARGTRILRVESTGLPAPPSQPVQPVD